MILPFFIRNTSRFVAILMTLPVVIGAPPTIEQVDEALNIAELAARHDMVGLSIQAIEKSLRFGPPVVSSVVPMPTIIHSGARVNTSLPVPKTPEEAILLRIPQTIFSLSEFWQKHADPVDVYVALRNVVVPPDRAGTVFLYNLPMKVDSLQPDRMPSSQSVAQELLVWAKNADRLADLRQHLEQEGLEQSVEASLLMLLTGLEQDDKEFIQTQNVFLRQQLKQGTTRLVAEMVALVGMTANTHGGHSKVAAQLLEASGVTLAAIDLIDAQADSPTRAVLLASARSWFSVGDETKGVDLLRQYLVVNVTGATAETLDSRMTEIVARELYGRGLINEARDLLGSENSSAYERRYRDRSLLNNSMANAEPMPTADSPAVRSAVIIAADQIASPDNVADQIWVCSLDTESQTSSLLFTLPDFRHAASPAVSPDGTEVAFDATLPGEAVTSDGRIYAAKLDGRSIRCLGRGTIPSWSPEGKRIAYSAYSPARGVWIMRSSGEDAQLIDSFGWSARWSPDGRMIAYSKLLNNRWDLIVYDIVEDEFFSLFREQPCPFVQIFPDFEWTPDSRQLVVKATRDRNPNNTQFEVSMIPVLQPTKFRKLYENRGELGDDLAWGNNDKGIVCVLKQPKHGAERLFYLNARTPSVPEYLEGQMPDRRNGGACWMPDGRTLVYISKPMKK